MFKALLPLGGAVLCVAAACGKAEPSPLAPSVPSARVAVPQPESPQAPSVTPTAAGARAPSQAVAPPTAAPSIDASPVPSPPGRDAGAQLADEADDADAGAPDVDAAAPPVADPATQGTASAPCTPNAYVSNSFDDSVSVIDTNTHAVVATIPTGSAPVNPVFTPDRKKVYVSNSQADTLTVIDVATNEATTMSAGGSNPSGLAFSPDGKTLYVSLIADFVSPGAVLAIDLQTGQASEPIPMGADPERIALTPDGKRLYVNNLLDGTMAVVDTQSRAVITRLMLGDLPFNPLLSPDGSVVYVGVMSANHIAVIDTTTHQVTRTIPADSPNGMTYSKDFQSLFVSNALAGTVQQVSLTSDMILKTAQVGGVPGNMAVLPHGELAYMVRPDGTTVEILDTNTLQIVGTIDVGEGPTVVTVCRPVPANAAP